MNRTILALAIGFTAGLSVLAAPASAQLQQDQSNPLADFQGQQSSDPFSSSSDNSSGIFNLLHRAVLGDLPSAASMSAAQQENLMDATTAFRMKQQQLLKQRQAQQSGAIVAPPTATPASGASLLFGPAVTPSTTVTP
jgi:hypothetical protein